MGVFSPSGTSGSAASSNPVTTPDITNQTLTNKDTEETVTIPAGVIKFMIKARNTGAKLQVSSSSGDSGTTYWTVWPGFSYDGENLSRTTDLDVYIQSSKDNTVLEILTWS